MNSRVTRPRARAAAARPHRAAQRSPCAAVLVEHPGATRSSASTSARRREARSRLGQRPPQPEARGRSSGDKYAFATRARARPSRARWAAHHVDSEVSILRHAPDDDQLLEVLLAKKAHSGPREREQLRDDGAHAAEVTRPAGPQSACASGPGSTYVWKPDGYISSGPDGAKTNEAPPPRICAGRRPGRAGTAAGSS